MGRPGRLGVGVIGAGKVGAVLGAALRAAEHAVVGVHAVSADSRERADALLPGVPVLPIEEIVRRSELVLLAVPDDALGPLVSGLAGAGRARAGYRPQSRLGLRDRRAQQSRLIAVQAKAQARQRARAFMKQTVRVAVDIALRVAYQETVALFERIAALDVAGNRAQHAAAIRRYKPAPLPAGCGRTEFLCVLAKDSHARTR